MKNTTSSLVKVAFGSLVKVVSSLAILGFVCALNVQAAQVNSTTGQVIKASEIRKMIPKVLLGDNTYEIVNSASFKTLQAEFASRINQMGLKAKWDRRFDCNKLVETFVVVAQIGYVTKSWHKEQAADSIAIGECWVIREDSTAHAMVFAMTERGLMFWDPQTASEVQLTPKQQERMYMAKI